MHRSVLKDQADRRMVLLEHSNHPLMRPLLTLMNYHTKTKVMLTAALQIMDYIDHDSPRV